MVFDWWLVEKTLQWGIICMKQAAVHLSGAQRSVELAAIGRRVAEVEWDLLELLAPEPAPPAAAGVSVRSARDSARALYGRPTAEDTGDQPAPEPPPIELPPQVMEPPQIVEPAQAVEPVPQVQAAAIVSERLEGPVEVAPAWRV